MITNQELILLIIIASDKAIHNSRLTEAQLQAVTSLKEKSLIQEDENDMIYCTNAGNNIVRVAKSGLSFNTLVNSLSNRHMTKLIHVVLESAIKKDIHLKVIFRNMSQDSLNFIASELGVAMDEIEAQGEKITDVPQILTQNG